MTDSALDSSVAATRDHNAPSSLSQQLADFLCGLRGRVNAELLDAAANCVIDTLGAACFGARLPWSKSAARYALDIGHVGECTVLGSDRTATPPMAAFANGAAAHAFEIDDVHEEAVNHPGAVVIPAALAMAEHCHASGREFLESVVVGYEAMGRAGLAVGPASHMMSGFHPTSMSGVFGAAAAAGALLGLDATGLNDAFGIAASLASGTMEFAASGGMAKRIHAARAAEGGMMAALLAADGFEGARDGLAGSYGFCRVFTAQPRPEMLTHQLGERWMIDEITVKPYAACSDIHPMIQATSELVAEHGLTAESIEKIVAYGPTKAVAFNDIDGTESVMAAQYSAQFNIAAAVLADPVDPATYSAERIRDESMAKLQGKVTAILPDPRYDATYAWKMGGRVQMTLHDHTVLEREVHGQRGSMHDPLSGDEIDVKFSVLTEDRLDTALPDSVRSLADRPLHDLTSLLRPSR